MNQAAFNKAQRAYHESLARINQVNDELKRVENETCPFLQQRHIQYLRQHLVLTEDKALKAGVDGYVSFFVSMKSAIYNTTCAIDNLQNKAYQRAVKYLEERRSADAN